MNGQDDRFRFSVEFGRRLRELRQEAGLSQQELAERMGRKGEGGHAFVGRLERASVSHPTLGLVADYLRACRAKFADIAGILDRYTSQPAVTELQGREAVRRLANGLEPGVKDKVVRYDFGTEIGRRRKGFKGRKHEPVDERLERVRKMARAWILRQKLENRLHAALNSLGIPGQSVVRIALAVHGRKVFGILNRSRKAKRDKLEQRLAEASRKLVQTGAFAEDAVEQITGVVVKWYHEMAQTGELDRLPSAGDARRLAAVSNRRRVKTDKEMCAEEMFERVRRYNEARNVLIDAAWKEAQGLVVEAGVPGDLRVGYSGAVRKYWQIAMGSAPRTDERRKMVEEYLAGLDSKRLDSELVRRIGPCVLKRFDKAKKGLPPSR